MVLKLTSTQVTVKHVNCLIYGESGIGKTVLCNTATKPLIISAEGGLLSLQDVNLPVFEIETRDNCNEVYEYLENPKNLAKYDTICIDSLSEIAEVLLSDELAKTKDPRQAYGVMAMEMSTLIRGFRDLPIHTYFSAKSKKVIDEDSGRITFMPSVPGQMLLNNLPYFFDEVFKYDMLRVKGVKHRALFTEQGANYIAKDRSGRLKPHEKPDLSYLFSKIIKTQPKPETKDAPITPKS